MCGQSIDSTAGGCRHCGECQNAERPTEEEWQRAARERFQASHAEGLYNFGLSGCLAVLCFPIAAHFSGFREVWLLWASMTVMGSLFNAVWGVIFLFYYRDPFPLRWKAVTGTTLNWILIVFLIACVVWNRSANLRF